MIEQDRGKGTRVIKARERPKTGVVIIEKTPGILVYRCPCDECDEIEEVSFLPRESRVFHCGICRKIAMRGKPSCSYSKRGSEIRYHTDCDRCGKLQKTTFLPGRERVFYCDACMREDRNQSRAEKPMKRGVKVLGTAEAPRFMAPCDTCRKRVEVAFAPREGERFDCSQCFAENRQRAAKKREKPETRIIYNLECVKCGRKETVSFIPSLPSEALCTQCFPKKERRKKS